MSLELRNVTKQVGADIYIHETNLTLAESSFNILLGATLAGKTTLMQLMAGLDRPSSGQIFFRGNDVTGVPVQKRNVSMVYQQFINYPNMNVYDNIASPLRVAGIPAAEIKTQVGKVAELLRLSPMLDRKPSELSGGQQQRTALARALVKNADLVLLDEPLANLDYKLREELRDELPRLFADRHCIVVYATTEPSEALLFGGNIATLYQGRVTAFGPTGDVYRQPADLLTAEVFSDPPINISTVRKAGNEIILTDTARWKAKPEIASLPDGELTLAIRPHHVMPFQTGNGAITIEGRVLVTELSGSESVVHFDLGGRTWVSQSHGIHRFTVGSHAQFYADVGQALYFDSNYRRIDIPRTDGGGSASRG